MTDEGYSTPAFYLNDTPTKLDVAAPPSPSVSPRRQSFTPGGTTKVLADLQAGILNTKNKLDDTKHQLRQSQRQVSQLTRQTEDLKEARERLRLENEGLNNVVARKERLLQEVCSTLFISLTPTADLPLPSYSCLSEPGRQKAKSSHSELNSNTTAPCLKSTSGKWKPPLRNNVLERTEANGNTPRSKRASRA